MQEFNYCYDKNGNYFERIKYGDKSNCAEGMIHIDLYGKDNSV